MRGHGTHMWMCGALVVVALVSCWRPAAACVPAAGHRLRADDGRDDVMMMGGMGGHGGGQTDRVAHERLRRSPAVPAAAAAPASTASRARPAAVGAAVLGVAPHVLHHVGPLAGAALLAGASGKLLFGALGFAAGRSRCCAGCTVAPARGRVPGGVLALMAIVFTFSTFVIGPALTAAATVADHARDARACPASSRRA